MRAKSEAIGSGALSQAPGNRQRVAALRDAGQLGAVETARFPRADAMLEAMALSDRCRVAASALDGLARHAADFEPATLKRRSHGIVRALFAELNRAVVFAFMLVLMVACSGGTTEAEPGPIGCAYRAPQAAFAHVNGWAYYDCPSDLGPTDEAQCARFREPTNDPARPATWACDRPGNGSVVLAAVSSAAIEGPL